MMFVRNLHQMFSDMEIYMLSQTGNITTRCLPVLYISFVTPVICHKIVVTMLYVLMCEKALSKYRNVKFIVNFCSSK